jgi:hypothetical protein
LWGLLNQTLDLKQKFYQSSTYRTYINHISWKLIIDCFRIQVEILEDLLYPLLHVRLSVNWSAALAVTKNTTVHVQLNIRTNIFWFKCSFLSIKRVLDFPCSKLKSCHILLPDHKWTI